MAGPLSAISAGYQYRQTAYSSPGPGTTLQIAQADPKRVYIGFFTKIGNDASITLSNDPSTGDFFDILAGHYVEFTVTTSGPLCQAAWYFGASALNTPLIVIEVWKIQA
jgi:hypothetical protein